MEIERVACGYQIIHTWRRMSRKRTGDEFRAICSSVTLVQSISINAIIPGEIDDVANGGHHSGSTLFESVVWRT